MLLYKRHSSPLFELPTSEPQGNVSHPFAKTIISICSLQHAAHILRNIGLAGDPVWCEIICSALGYWEISFCSLKEQMKGVVLQPFVTCNHKE